jgi:transposase
MNNCSDYDRLRTECCIVSRTDQRSQAVQLLKQPGVGPVTALAFVLTIGPVARFQRSRQVVSYLGINPREESSGGRQRLGSISKQGNPMLRHLLIEAAQAASKFDPELRRDIVAIARKLAVRLYWKQFLGGRANRSDDE